MSFIQKFRSQNYYYEIIEKAQNERETDEAIEKIDSLLSSKTEEEQKQIWEHLYNQYKQISCFESLDNQHFYKLMSYKKQQLVNKLQGKKQ
ncbi:hypothetical protein C3007_01980 [Avibacterium gallinarum]|uniref:Uncharacterized protein n=1 Tax=Avibacterium gallinarum TaxID=755 RepID=A0A379AX95_AVIGA|nr:hypothetical protein [Avibacterium gallinarum]POY45026.1 hypothetical protein C3007_01980 [Avibacterium gallinarum]TDP28855.1 hypothetical protein EV689_104119 [Avibacterium gallinarum]SUB26362.1 Uncharacterised protein [Avibacterium gallinarum]